MDERKRAASRLTTTIAERFRLDRLLGVGGMGAVYEAHDPWTDRRVALKLLHKSEVIDGGEGQRSDERFFREARLVAKLDHPHIVRLFDLGRAEDGSLYLVQELLEGEDLRKTLRARGKLDEKSALEVMIAVCDAVAHAHAMGVVHRDLKPENIFVQRTKSARLVAKVIDFGIARSVSRDHRLTPTGHVFGTPSYMAPEQADGHSPVARSWDLWALAIIAYECLTGRNPYARDNVLATLSALLKDPAPPIATQREGLSPALCAAIDRALERSIDQRFSGAIALRDALIAAGGLEATPWVSALLERSRDELAPSDARPSHERLASDSSVKTAATARTEGTADVAPSERTDGAESAPRAKTEATEDVARNEQTLSTDTAFEVELAHDELAAIGLNKSSHSRRTAGVALVAMAAAATVALAWRRQEPAPTVPLREARPATTISAASAAPTASVGAAPVDAPVARGPVRNTAPRAIERARRTTAVIEAPRREPAVIEAAPTPAQTARPTQSNPFIDDETSTPIRRYP